MLLHGDVLDMLKTLDSESVHCCVTSPPYWGLRDYGVEGQLGLEKTPQEYIAKMVEVFREVRRVLRKDGTVWLNIGDSYYGSGKGSGHDEFTLNLGRTTLSYGGDVRNHSLQKHDVLKPKDLCLIPFRLAIALQEDGWWVRSDIIWAKPNPMPESVTDRPTKAHEYIFLMSKSQKYFYDAEAIKEKVGELTRRAITFRNDRYVQNETFNNGAGFSEKIKAIDGEPSLSGRNIRTVWTIPTQPTPEAHFATFPEALIVPCIKAGTSEKGCCPKCGSPWERVSEKIGIPTRPDKTSKYGTPEEDIRGGSETLRKRIINTFTHLGWQSTCKCSVEQTQPCTVLDPFFGSGTTGIVAKKLQRKWIGIELNAEYIRIAEKRIEKECGLLL